MNFWIWLLPLLTIYLVLVVVVGKAIAYKDKAEKRVWDGLHREGEE